MKTRAIVLIAALCVATSAYAQNAQTYAQQRVDKAQHIVEVLTLMYTRGQATLEDLSLWTGRVFQAKRDAGVAGPALIAAAQQWVDKMRAIEQLVQARVSSGTATSVEADKAAFYRLEAEMTLAKLKTP